MLKGRQNGPGRHAHRSGDACSRTFSVSRARSRQQQVTIPLGRTIVAAFGFDFDHAFGFYSGRTERTLMSAKPKYELFADMGRDAFGDKSDALSVKKTRIIDAFPKVGHAMTFLFDYGDEWLFRVEVVGLGQKVAKVRYPRVLKEGGEAPEQYPDPDRTTQKNIREGVSRARTVNLLRCSIHSS